MLHLVLKDILLQKKTLMIMLPILFIYLFTGASAIWVGCLFCIAIIMNAFSSDEKSSINILLNSLPYTRKEIVSSKYIGACVFTFLVLLTIFIGHLFVNKEIIQWEQLLFITSIVAVFISLAFPFSYLFKSQYLMIAFGIAFVIYFITAQKFVPDLNDRIRGLINSILSLNNSHLYLLIVVSVFVLYISSWILSIRIYKNKAF